QVPHRTSQQATHIGDLPTLSKENDIDNQPTMNLESFLDENKPTDAISTTGRLRAINLVPLQDEEKKDEEDEEEKRRRAALLGFGLPWLGDLADQPTIGQIPGVQGTPQVQQVASLQGTPPLHLPEIVSSEAFNPGLPTVLADVPSSAPFHPGSITHFP